MRVNHGPVGWASSRKRAVLTQEGEGLRTEAGRGHHRLLDWSSSPNTSWFATHPMA